LSVVNVVCCRGLCDKLITRPGESYRLCCVVACDLETTKSSWMRRRPRPTRGLSRRKKNILYCVPNAKPLIRPMLCLLINVVLDSSTVRSVF